MSVLWASCDQSKESRHGGCGRETHMRHAHSLSHARGRVAGDCPAGLKHGPARTCTTCTDLHSTCTDLEVDLRAATGKRAGKRARASARAATALTQHGTRCWVKAWAGARDRRRPSRRERVLLGKFEGAGGRLGGHGARAGWALATSHDSDQAPDTRRPRKDEASR